MDYQYDVAISFAGEDRPVASELARLLKERNVKVFYDEYEEETLWGVDLYEHLHEVYSQKARYCIMLLSEHYAKKAWTDHERKSAQERAFRERQTYILPIKLDNTVIPGIRDTIGYLTIKNHDISAIADVLLKKLGKESLKEDSAPLTAKKNPPTFSIPLPQTKRAFSERDRDLFLTDAYNTIVAFFQEGINKLGDTGTFEADMQEVNSMKFTCKVYREGKRKSACTIWIGSKFSSSSSINYLTDADPDAGNSINESLSVEAGGNELKLNALMNVMSAHQGSLSVHQAAEYLWSKLIAPLSR